MITKPKRSDKQSRFDAFPYIDYSVGRGGGPGFTMLLFILIFSIPYITGKFIIRTILKNRVIFPSMPFLELGAVQRVRLEIQAERSGKVFVNTWKPTILGLLLWIVATVLICKFTIQN